MVNLDEDFEEVSNTLPKGLLYSKETGLIIQSEVEGVEKALYITPEHLSKNEDSLFNEEGKINADFMSDGILPAGLSFEKGILKIGDGNQYGGLIVNNLMAITSIPVGEDMGTGKDLYLLERGQSYYQPLLNPNNTEEGPINITTLILSYDSSHDHWIYDKDPDITLTFKKLNNNELRLLNVLLKTPMDIQNYLYHVTITYPELFYVTEIGDGLNNVFSDGMSDLSSIQNFLTAMDKFQAYFHYQNFPVEEYSYISRTTRINAHAYEGTNVKGFNGKVENSVTYYGLSAFENCKNLQDITFDCYRGIEEEDREPIQIEESCFQDCTGLSQVYIISKGELNFTCNNAIQIGSYTFSGCSNLDTFGDCNENTSPKDRIYFKQGDMTPTLCSLFSRIGKGSFQGCKSLKTFRLYRVNVPESAFEDCTSLTKIFFNIYATYHYQSTYNGNIQQDTTSDMSDDITISFGNRAFYGCENLTNIYDIKKNYYVATNVYNPSSNNDNDVGITSSSTILDEIESRNLNWLSSIGDYCFYNNKKLHFNAFPTKVQYVGKYAFYNCSKLGDISLGDTIQEIGEYAFRGCDDVTIQKIPKNNTYTIIQEGTFDSCNFDLDEIPETIQEIESGAFNNGYGRISSIKCPNLILRNGSFTFMEFTEDIDATAVQNFTIEENAFKTALGKMKVNANVFQQLVSSGRARPKGQEEDIYYIDSKDFIIEKVEI